MSFRKRAKPVLSASVVTKVRSKPTEKINKILPDDKIENVGLNSTEKSDPKAKPGTDSTLTLSESAGDANPSQDVLHDVDKCNQPTINVNRATGKTSIASNRFMKARSSINLFSRKSKNGDNCTSQENRPAGDSSCKTGLTDEQISDETETRLNNLEACPNIDDTDELKVKDGECIKKKEEWATVSKDIPKKTDSVFDNQVADQPVLKKEISSFIVTSRRISDVSNLDKHDIETDSKDCQHKDDCKDAKDVSCSNASTSLGHGASNDEMALKNTEEVTSSLPSIKSRFKKSKLIPNVGSARKENCIDTDKNDIKSDKTGTEDNSLLKSEVGKTDDKSSSSKGRFKRTKITPKLVTKRPKLSSRNENEIPVQEGNVDPECSTLKNTYKSAKGTEDTNTKIVRASKMHQDLSSEVTTNDETHTEEKDSNASSASLSNVSTIVAGENGNKIKTSSKKETENLQGDMKKGTDNKGNENKDEKTNNKHAKKEIGSIKKFRRSNFKPNVKIKGRKETSVDSNVISNSKSTSSEKISSDLLSKPGEENNQQVILPASESENLETFERKNSHSKKHVHFTQNILENCDITNLDSGTESTRSRTGKKSRDLSTETKSVEDMEKNSISGVIPPSDNDGSQSENESALLHGKRKFAPCLGPRVRQRRRLSSMTLSEDEGGFADVKSNDTSSITENLGFVVENSTVTETNGEVTTVDENSIETKKKKKKRSRIVIKEPKEKMTMFDFIYYNPQSDDKEKVEKEEGKKQQKRLDESNVLPETETVLETINDDSGKPVIGSDADDTKTTNENDDDHVIAPQIKIGEDGNIVIDEESLLLKTTRSKMSLEGSKIVYDDGGSFDPYRRRKDAVNKKKRWPLQETLKFYRALSRVGTDFSLMAQFFPDCTRRNLKQKFKTEEKFNCDLIDRALKNMLPMDEALFLELEKPNKSAVKDDEKEVIREEEQAMEVAENVTI